MSVRANEVLLVAPASARPSEFVRGMAARYATSRHDIDIDIDLERTTALSSDSLIVWLCVELTNQLLVKLPSENQDDAPSNEQVPALDNDMGIADWSVGTKYFGAEIRVRFLPTHVYRALTTQARRQLIARDSTRAMIVLFAPDVVRTRRSVVAVHRDRHSFD